MSLKEGKFFFEETFFSKKCVFIFFGIGTVGYVRMEISSNGNKFEEGTKKNLDAILCEVNNK